MNKPFLLAMANKPAKFTLPKIICWSSASYIPASIIGFTNSGHNFLARDKIVGASREVPGPKVSITAEHNVSHVFCNSEASKSPA